MKENREQNVVEMQNHPFSGDELITDPVKILDILFFPAQNDMLFAILVFLMLVSWITFSWKLRRSDEVLSDPMWEWPLQILVIFNKKTWHIMNLNSKHRIWDCLLQAVISQLSRMYSIHNSFCGGWIMWFQVCLPPVVYTLILVHLCGHFCPSKSTSVPSGLTSKPWYSGRTIRVHWFLGHRMPTDFSQWSVFDCVVAHLHAL